MTEEQILETIEALKQYKDKLIADRIMGFEVEDKIDQVEDAINLFTKMVNVV